MSFASKQANRDARKPRSYIGSKENIETTGHVVSSKAEPGSSTKEAINPGMYANLPHSTEIRRDEKRGRGIWCTQTIKRGSIILNQRPHVAVLATPNLPLHCSYCTRPSEEENALKRCTKCRIVWYCSSVCQNDDWKVHKYECSAIKNWVSSAPDGLPPGEAIRSLGRILWGRKIKGEISVWWSEIKALQSHRSSIPVSAIDSHAQLAHALVRYLEVTSPSELESYGMYSSGDLVDLVSQFSTNTFTLTSPTLSPLGTCISPIAALFNHSCLPNAVIVFPHQSHPTGSPATSKGLKHHSLHVIAIKDIVAGEEILTAYIDASLPTSLRQLSLKETYAFECTCPLCTLDASEIDPREALWCPKSCGGMCPSPKIHDEKDEIIPRCIKCRAEFTPAALEDVRDKLRVGREALDKATSLQFSDPARALNLTSHILPLLSQLPPSAHPALALLRLHQTLLITSMTTNATAEILNDTIRSSARAVSGLISVFVEGHPVRCICLAELGKLLAVDEPPPTEPTGSNATPMQSDGFPPSGAARLALAVDTLKRALRELMIGFGESTGGGDVGRDIRETIVKLEEELNVYKRGVRNVLKNSGDRTR